MESPKRIALCLSGQLRNYKLSIENLKQHIIDKYNTDVFIHTWTDTGHQVPHHYIKDYTHNYQEIDYSSIGEYNPKKIKIENPNYNWFKSKTPEERFYNTLMMWYSINQANTLRKEFEQENNFQYHCVIRCRFDLFFEHFEIGEVSPDTIYLPPHDNIDHPFTPSMREQLKIRGWSYMPNDQLSWGDSSSMDYYCDVYDILSNDINYYVHHPEGLLSEHLFLKNKSKITPMVKEEIKMKILR